MQEIEEQNNNHRRRQIFNPGSGFNHDIYNDYTTVNDTIQYNIKFCLIWFNFINPCVTLVCMHCYDIVDLLFELK